MPISVPEKNERLWLDAETAADLMVTNLFSLRDDATAREAMAVLTDKGFNAASVIDAKGKPVGVISRADLLVNSREMQEGYKNSTDVAVPDSQLKEVETRVHDMMTPVVFSEGPQSGISKVVADMTGMNVNQLFAIDDTGTRVGIVRS